jgi:hypothetical protein
VGIQPSKCPATLYRLGWHRSFTRQDHQRAGSSFWRRQKQFGRTFAGIVCNPFNPFNPFDRFYNRYDLPERVS